MFTVSRALRARHLAVPAALVLLAALVFLAPTPAAAQRDRCADYANGMVAQDQRARQMRCPGWTSHSNYGGHYGWCQQQTPQRVQQAISNWQSRFQACQFAAGGSPAARTDASRCIAYGDEMVRMDRMARQQACRGWTSHSNRNHHIQWCQLQTPERVNGALSDWRRRLRAC